MNRPFSPRVRLFLASLVAVLVSGAAPGLAEDSVLNRLHQVNVVASTVPANGDVNPYGIVRVPVTTGKLKRGHILISNFNNSANLQGTGSTIVDVAPDGTVGLFAQIDAASLPGPCPGGVGLTTALVALRSGWVIVGSLPTTDGSAATAQAGCLLVIDRNGKVVQTISGGVINGPWDATAFDGGELAAIFVTNVLNGTVAANGNVVNEGTVVRLILRFEKGQNPKLLSTTVIGSGFPERTDAAALVIGPTGLALDGDGDVLYINDSLDNRIAAIRRPLSRKSDASTGATLFQGGALNDPLGLARAVDGHLIAANGDDGNLVEIIRSGAQVATKLVDSSGTPAGAGALFGVLVTPNRVFFVDDATNTLNVLEK